jgi:hypothetical protein
LEDRGLSSFQLFTLWSVAVDAAQRNFEGPAMRLRQDFLVLRTHPT